MNGELQRGGNEVAKAGVIDSGSQDALRLRDIPLRLFNEVSQALGIGNEQRLVTDFYSWRIRLLDPNRRATGFPCAIGFREMEEPEQMMFGFWPSIPKLDQDGSVPPPRLCFNGGLTDGRAWSAGHGRKITEQLYADFAMDRFYFPDPANTLMLMLLLRAEQLAERPDVVREQFWEADRYSWQ